MTYDNGRYEDDGHYGGGDYDGGGYDGGGYDESGTDRAAERRQWALTRGLRALSGTVAAGIVILTFVVIGSAYLGGQRGFPGPGTASITAHVLASVVALAAQIWCDRRRGVAAVGASVVVLVTAGVLLVTQWWG